MAERTARVYSIPLGVDFPDTLAAALISGRLLKGWPDRADPLSLSSATIYLPTRRAARALRERLAVHMQSDVMLLPRIIPLGGIDEAEDRMIFSEGLAALDRLELKPEIPPAQRRIILARLITAWSDAIQFNLHNGNLYKNFAVSLADGLGEDRNGFVVAASPRDALQLADSLGQLIDTLTIHGKTWQDIHDLVPQDLADDYWKISRDFLEIAAREWPDFCSKTGVLDAAERRHKLVLSEVDRLHREALLSPVIVAGSTGTMPATAALIRAIAYLPNGAVVLPGLDQDLDDASFTALTDSNGMLLEPQHPQAQLRRLIATLGVSRNDVETLGSRTPNHDKRMRFLTEALRPVSTTDQWQTRATRITDKDLDDALDHVKLIEATHEREEATAIAIALREALNIPEKTAALITPDRSLAERVQSELKRWNIDVEDSAGMSLARTPAGRLALLFAGSLAENFSPWSVLALLSHPDAQFGLPADKLERARRALDIGLYRHVSYPIGLEAIAAECVKARQQKPDHHRPKPEQNLTEADWDAALDLISMLKAISTDFINKPDHDLVSLLPSHEQALRQIAATQNDPDRWDMLNGASEIADLFSVIAPADSASLNGSLSDYANFLDGLMRGVMVRDHSVSHPRIKIFGLLEARLLSADLAILAGLDETVWPPEIKTDPFLNRPWRQALALPEPERRIGQTAHDFMSAMGAQEVILSRSLKRAGAPTVPSRFLQRMRAVAGDQIFGRLISRGYRYLQLAQNLDDKVEQDFARYTVQPQPVVTRNLLPHQLSVTRIETLRRDPYAIYAQYVLGLDPLKPVAPQIGASEIGTAFHDALAAFGLANPYQLPEHARDELLRYGQNAFQAISHEPEFFAFWWPRFERAADWYLQWEVKRRADLFNSLQIEKRGALKIELPRGGEFTLTARADRIELHHDQTFSVLDYKTGTPSSAKEVRVGLSPQLTLEAAMVQRGAFGDLKATEPRDLSYIKLGSREGGKEQSAIAKGKTADQLVTQHFEEFVRLIDEHWNGGKAFASRPIAKFAMRYSDYDHLARVKEWAMNSEGEEGAES